MDVDDVHVGDVVELPRPALAHRDDRHAHAGLRVQLRARDRKGGLDGGAGQIGQDPGDLVDHGLGSGGLEIVSGQPQHLVAVGPAQGVDPLLPRHPGDGGDDLPVGVRVDGVQEGVAQDLGGGARHVEGQVSLAHEREGGVGVAHDVIRQCLRCPGDREQAGQQCGPVLRIGQHVQQLAGVRGHRGLDDPQEAQRGRVRVDGGLDPGDDLRLRGEVRAQVLVDLAQEPGHAADPGAGALPRGIAAPPPRHAHSEPKSCSSSKGVT